jgi:uncharacterized protein (DUF1778 family)
MTKHFENGKLIRVHIHLNQDDADIIKTFAKSKGISIAEFTRQSVHTALRGLRPGQIIAYDRVLRYDMENAQRFLTRAIARIQKPKQGTTIIELPHKHTKRKKKC